ncbi:MAG: gliding motility protein GldN [Prevotella sp.]|nr:gliding motility protein GldN [Prevotella sp.]MBR4240370.1 gliding motility protein GldN [Prevotella sp.]
MKRSLLIFAFFNFLIATAVAQPQRRRTTTQQQSSTSAAQKSNANTMTTRAQLSFPTQATMSEDVVWRRDIYREVDLHDDANAGLYYPKEPVGTQMNLFTYIFKLMMRGTIKAYEYRLDGNELFTDSARIKPLQFLKDQGIYFERTDKGVRLEDSDIPSKEVTAYYIKESAYYDQATSTFHTKALALCPIWVEEWGGESERKPLFWVKYDELAPFLAKQTIMTSNLNNAATMSIDDFFTLNMYKGKIYKTNNMLGESLAKICGNDSSKISAEQRRIEAELKEFESHIWGDDAKNDSLDSVSVAPLTKKGKKSAVSRPAAAKKEKTAKPRRSSGSASSSSSSSARVTVRRQRH